MTKQELINRNDYCREKDLCFISLRPLPNDKREIKDIVIGTGVLTSIFHSELNRYVIIYKEYQR